MARDNRRSPYEPERHGRPIPVVVRNALPADSEGIALVDVTGEARTDGERVQLIRQALVRNSEDGSKRYTCVALVAKRIVGFGKCAHTTWSENPEDSHLPEGWYLTGVEVRRNHRHMGIGRALTIHRLEWLRARTDAVYYFTGERNLPSRDLHGALGFEEVAHGVFIPLPPPFSNEELHVLGKKVLGHR